MTTGALVAQARTLRNGIAEVVAAPAARRSSARAAYGNARDDVVGPHFEALCRDWAAHAGEDLPPDFAA